MFKLFIQGGAGFMTILTVLLVAIFFAAPSPWCSDS